MTFVSGVGAVDLEPGQDLGVTEWITISQEDVWKFADATRAKEWVHVDVERARRDSPFRNTVAHGYLTLGLATPFVTELVGIDPESAVGVNYGLDRVRFPEPVPVGSRVRARGRVKVVEPHGQGVRLVTNLTYEIEGVAKPACVAEVISLILPLDDASGVVAS